MRIASARTRGLGSAVSFAISDLASGVSRTGRAERHSVINGNDTYLDKRIDGENDEFGLRFGIVHEI